MGGSGRCSGDGSIVGESVEQIIEEKHVHRAQVAALSQMQLQAMERVEAQEEELWRLSALLEEHQAVLRSSPERPCQKASHSLKFMPA